MLAKETRPQALVETSYTLCKKNNGKPAWYISLSWTLKPYHVEGLSKKSTIIRNPIMHFWVVKRTKT